MRIKTIDEPNASGFIMEFVEGDTLGDLIQKGVTFSIKQVIDILPSHKSCMHIT